MDTLKLTKNDFKETKYYYKEYCGKTDVSNYEGNIEIEEGLGYVKFNGWLRATGYILAKAGSGIKAGEGIEAGEGIKAGEGITSGLYISCKLSLNIGLRIFAGVCWWRNINDVEKTITCGKLEKGKVEYGILKETGLPEQKEVSLKGKEVEVKLDGKTYKAIIQ